MKKLSLLAIVITAAACSQAADEAAPADCDGQSGGASAGTGAGTGTGTGTGMGTGTGTGPATGNDAGTGTGTTTKEVKSGFVSLSQTTFVAGTTTINSFTAFAGFSKTIVTGTTSADCKQSVDAECNVTECTTPTTQPDAGAPTDAGTPAPVKAPTAGKITVAAAQSLDLAADDKGAYAVKSGQTLLFAPGATIGIKALGDSVPAFETSFKGPAAVTITAPVWPAAGQAVALDRTKALPLVWTGGGEGSVSLTVSATATGKTTILSCKFASKDNKGTISAAAMGKLFVTDSGTISVNGSSTVNVEKDDWKIVVMANTPAKAGSSFASGLAKVK